MVMVIVMTVMRRMAMVMVIMMVMAMVMSVHGLASSSKQQMRLFDGALIQDVNNTDFFDYIGRTVWT